MRLRRVSRHAAAVFAMFVLCAGAAAPVPARAASSWFNTSDTAVPILDTIATGAARMIDRVAVFFSRVTDTFALTSNPPPALQAAAAASGVQPAASWGDVEVTAAATTMPPAPQTTVIRQPVIERIIEKTIPQPSGVSPFVLATMLASLRADILSRIPSTVPALVSPQVAAGGSGLGLAGAGASQRIDQLTNTTINTPTITGGSISGTSIAGYLPTSGSTASFTTASTTALAITSIPWGLLSTNGSGTVVATSSPTVASITATSTTATSTFAGVVDTNGLITTNGIYLTIASTTNFNYFFGGAGNLSITGIANTAVGRVSLLSNTTGGYNSTLGYGALGLNTTGSNNTAIGYSALLQNTSATNVVAIGYAAGLGGSSYSNQGGTLVGYQSGYSSATGSDYNTFLGYQAGYGITTGSNNIWIGTATSSTGIANLTTGSQNILIGNNISLPSATASGQLNIGNIIFGTGITGTGSTISSGKIGIGTTTPGALLGVNGNILGAGILSLTGTSGTSTIASGQGFTIGSSQFVVQQGSGNIGIGTNAPATTLHTVSSDTSLGGVLFQNTSSLATAMFSTVQNSRDTSALGDGVGYGFMMRSSVTNVRQEYGYIGALIESNGEATQDGSIIFAPRRSGSRTETMRLVSSGNLGLGTTTPSANLVVNGTTGQNLFQIASSTNQNVLTVTTNGRVGIGTGSPGQKLHVSGDANINGMLIGANTILGNSSNGLLRFDGSNVSFSSASGGDLYIQRDQGNNIYIGNSLTNKVAIGSNVAGSMLSVYGNLSVGTSYQSTAAPTNGAILEGSVGVGTSTPSRALTTFSSTAPQLSLSAGAGSNEWTFRNAGGILYIATSTYSATSSVSAFTLDANGNLTIVGSATTCTIGNGTSATSCSSSDQRLKDDITTLDAASGLSAIQALNPVSFHWNPWMQQMGNSSSTQYGLIAQQVQSVFPNLVQEDPHSHYYKLDYQGLFAPIIKAIQEIASLSGAFKTSLIAWLGDTGNGIGDFFANRVIGKQLCAKKSDGTLVCVTGEQLATALAAQDNVDTGGAAADPISAPILVLDGNASSTIPVGATYNDLGARITGPQSDLNLGIAILLDGATTTAVSIDTSTAGTHRILYTVTSPTSGLTSSISRTVIVGDTMPDTATSTGE